MPRQTDTEVQRSPRPDERRVSSDLQQWLLSDVADAHSIGPGDLSDAIDRFERRLHRIHGLVAGLSKELSMVRSEYVYLAVAAQHAVHIARPGRLAELSPAEFRIALRAASGATDAEIATSLRVSSNTVKSHMKAVLQKLGLHSRWELAHVAFRHSEGVVGAQEREVHSPRSGRSGC
jgi:DNA-binding CsgD family transcriptional regulator